MRKRVETAKAAIIQFRWAVVFRPRIIIYPMVSKTALIPFSVAFTVGRSEIVITEIFSEVEILGQGFLRLRSQFDFVVERNENHEFTRLKHSQSQVVRQSATSLPAKIFLRFHHRSLPSVAGRVTDLEACQFPSDPGLLHS